MKKRPPSDMRVKASTEPIRIILASTTVHRTRVRHDAFDLSRLKLPKPSPILTCACSRKYIKTRERQKACIPCLHGLKETIKIY